MGKNKDTKPTNQYELANMSFKMGNYKDAIKKLEIAINENPKDYLSLFLMGKCYSKQIGNNANNCYKAQQYYLDAIKYLDKAKVSEIKEREIKRDITIEYANSFIELVNNNRKVYNASFDKEPKDVQSKAWEKWCNNNDILEENFLNSLESGLKAFEDGYKTLEKFSDQSSIDATNHFKEYSLNYIEDLFAYGKESDELKNQWFDLLTELRISKQDNSYFSEKLANPLTLDRQFDQQQKDLSSWKIETKKNLQDAYNRYLSKNSLESTAALRKYAGVDLPLEAREKEKSEQELIDESIEEIKAQKKNARINVICAVIAGICLFLGFRFVTKQLYKSAVIMVIAVVSSFPFIYKRMNNQRLAQMLRILTPIMLLILALLS